VVQEYWGIVEHIKDVCDRFAAEGFAALAPDMYHGNVAKSPDDAGKLMMALNIAQAGKDLRGAATYLLGRADVSGPRVPVLGFCMGGQLALFAAQEYPEVIAAAVDFYGVHPKVTIHPDRVKVPVQFHFAERDNSTPLPAAHALEAALKHAGVQVEAHYYDAEHAFFNDTRPRYDAASAKLAWRRTIEFLGKC
jgi:carboxymethylenebutenolidase